MRAGEVRVELYCSGEIANSRVELAQLAVEGASVEIGDCILWVQSNMFGAVVCDCS